MRHDPTVPDAAPAEYQGLPRTASAARTPGVGSDGVAVDGCEPDGPALRIRQRKLGGHARAPAAGAVDLEPAAERLRALAETVEAAAARHARAADAVVVHLDRECALGDLRLHRDMTGACVLGHVRERFGD